MGSFFAPEFQNLQKMFQKMQKMQFLGFKAFVFSWNMFIFAKAKATKNINNLNNVSYEEKKLFVFLSNHLLSDRQVGGHSDPVQNLDTDKFFNLKN